MTRNGGATGFEPAHKASQASVLPLHHALHKLRLVDTTTRLVLAGLIHPVGGGFPRYIVNQGATGLRDWGGWGGATAHLLIGFLNGLNVVSAHGLVVDLIMEPDAGIQPALRPYEGIVPASTLIRQVGPRAGIEPATVALQKRCSTVELPRQNYFFFFFT